MLSTTQGVLGESIFITECIKRNIEICNPIVDKFGYDFIVNNGSWVTVQVKTCSVADNRYISTTSYKINIRKGAQNVCYDEGDFDYLAAYLIPLDIWYIMPFSMINNTTIRINPHSDKCKFSEFKGAFKLLKSQHVHVPAQ